jgi:hypothetical protein
MALGDAQNGTMTEIDYPSERIQAPVSIRLLHLQLYAFEERTGTDISLRKS